MHRLLNDGLQSPAVSDTRLDRKLELIELMDRLGIHTTNLGLPGAGGRARAEILAMARHIVARRLRIGAKSPAAPSSPTSNPSPR